MKFFLKVDKGFIKDSDRNKIKRMCRFLIIEVEKFSKSLKL